MREGTRLKFFRQLRGEIGLDPSRSHGHHRGMAGLTAIPARGEVFLDERDSARALRVSWHNDAADGGTVVLSLWRGSVCSGSFRLRRQEVPALIAALSMGLAPTLGPVPARPDGRHPPIAG